MRKKGTKSQNNNRQIIVGNVLRDNTFFGVELIKKSISLVDIQVLLILLKIRKAISDKCTGSYIYK